MLKTKLCGTNLLNPLILASGILGVSKKTLIRVLDNGAGAVTLKSVCHEEREGNKSPTIIANEDYMLNAVGLPGQGAKNLVKEYGDLAGQPFIASIFGYTIEDFGRVTRVISKINPIMIEIDVSCPHHDYGKPICTDPELLARVTREVKNNTELPVSVKLSPNVNDIIPLAIAVEKAGADCITAINTAIGMSIDIDARAPVLANKVGGLSGPALKPIAVRCVYQIFENVKIPIIGTGGVSTGRDAIEMIMAGATAVGVGTAAWIHGPGVFSKITKEIEEWMKKNKVSSLDKIRGIAHA